MGIGDWLTQLSHVFDLDGDGKLNTIEKGFAIAEFLSQAEEELYKEDKLYEEDYLDEDKQLVCPTCGDVLNDQPGFDELEDDWVCDQCGAHLHRDLSEGPYEEVEENLLECPVCGDKLNDQFGFSEDEDEWICEFCNTPLTRDYVTDEFVITEDKDDFEENLAEEDAGEENYSNKTSDLPLIVLGSAEHEQLPFDELVRRILIADIGRPESERIHDALDPLVLIGMPYYEFIELSRDERTGLLVKAGFDPQDYPSMLK